MRKAIAGVILACAAMLLFARLGHYALWDDEAVTALAGEGVWRTGDTSVVLDHNIVAYRSGLLLRGTRERSTPPLGAYLAAPFVGVFDGSTFAARFPFALLGMASTGLILWWLYRINAPPLAFGVVGLALVGNVSLWLYCRQCRYYSPAIFSSILIVYLYLTYNGKAWQLVLLALAGLMLLASNYLNYVALHLCLLADYLLIGRKRRWLSWKEWLVVLAPQVLLGGSIVMIWNTLGTGNAGYFTGNSLAQRIQLIWMNLRDINACEYGVGLFVLISPLLFFSNRVSWFWRGPAALVLYVVVISLLSPQVLGDKPVDADVRYLAPVIPLMIAIGALVVLEMRKIHWSAAVLLALIAFESNLLNGAWINDAQPPRTPLRSTVLWFAGELVHPLPEPYSPTIDWLKQNVAAGESIWVLPDYMAYPLMFHAPQYLYAWQFKDQLPAAFKELPAIHRMGGTPPDWIIAFGPIVGALSSYSFPQGAQYRLSAKIPVFWHDMYRPELLWHNFTPIQMNESRVNSGDGIYVFKKVTGGAEVRP